MKRLLFVLLFAASYVCGAAPSEINYCSKPWAEIKARAKTEHKYIIVDCYTDWCGWCKVMDKETMTDPGVAAILNNDFVPVKMDMEKGEGTKLAMKYHVTGFPTFLFFNEQGDFVYQLTGYQKRDDFITGLNNCRAATAQFKAPGFSGSTDIDFPEFYKKVFAGNGKREFPKGDEITAFLDKQKDLFSEVSWGVISLYQAQADTKHTQFFLDNIARYRQLYGGANVDEKVQALIGEKLQSAIKNKSDEEFAGVMKMAERYGDGKEDTKTWYKISYYKETKNWQQCCDALASFIAVNGYENGMLINDVCWALYENCTDMSLLDRGVKWMQQTVAKESSYAYLDTYASLLYKAGQKADAGLWAKKAIETGKEKGETTASTEALLKKINGGQ